MILGRIGIEVKEDFSVTDPSRSLVPGIDETSFTYNIFAPNGDEVSSTIPVSISELGHGHYRAEFLPNVVGTWMLAVYHSTYFPWGKTGSIQIFSNDFDTVTILIQRVLGLVQENFFIDQAVYDDHNNLLSSRIRTYTNEASVGTNNDILAEYYMEASYVDSKMETYKVKKL